MVLTLLTAPLLLLAELPEPVRERFNCSADGSAWPYLVQLPEGEPAAVLVYLHGHYGNEAQGMTPETYNDCFGRLRSECLARGWAYVTPWYGGNTWMNELSESGLADLIGLLHERWPERPVYLVGGSMGATSALIFAHRRPELIDGVIALCPAGDIESYYAFAAASEDGTLANIAAAIRLHYQVGGRDLAEELRARSSLRHAECFTMPVVISHGSADALIPIDGTRRLVDRLRELEAPLLYHEIPEGDHNAPVHEVDWPEVLGFVQEAAG